MLYTGSFSFMKSNPCRQEVMLQTNRLHWLRQNLDMQMFPLRTMLHTSLKKLCFQLGPVHTTVRSVQIPAHITALSRKQAFHTIKLKRWFLTFHFLFLNPDALLPEAKLSPGSPPTPLPQTRPPRRHSCWANVLAVPDQLHILCIPQRKPVPQQQFQRGLPQPQPDQA